MGNTLLMCLFLVISFTNANSNTLPKFMFTGGSILTMDPSRPEVEAMVIEGSKILALGTKASMKNSFPDSISYDLKSKTLLPGFIDSHVHVGGLGAKHLFADVSQSRTVKHMVAQLKEFYPNPKPGMWIIGQGWDEGVWASLGYPDRSLLDESFPKNPVKLESRHGFAAFYNQKALNLAGINKETKNPPGGTILRRENGDATGVLLTLAKKLVDQHIPELTVAQREQAILKGMEIMAEEGVTMIHEAGIKRSLLPVWKGLAKRRALPLRVYGMLDGNDEWLVEQTLKTGIYNDPRGFLSLRSFKVYYDGSLGSRTALLSKPYTDLPDKANMTERISIDKIKSLALLASPKGYQLNVHAIGDEANKRIIGLYRSIKQKYPNKDLRWRLEHAQVLYPEAFKEIAELGLMPSMQPSHAVGDSKWAHERLGHDRLTYAYNWRRILDAGATLLLNSDLPGEPWTPRETLYFASTRTTLDGKRKFLPDQGLRLQEILEAMTFAGALGSFDEERLGRLTKGRLADFVILDRNPLKVPKEQLKDLKVASTWVGGKKIFPRPLKSH